MSKLYLNAKSDSAAKKTMTGNEWMEMEVTYGNYPGNYRGVTVSAVYDKKTGRFGLSVGDKVVFEDTLKAAERIRTVSW
jgi:hypothetical protein